MFCCRALGSLFNHIGIGVAITFKYFWMDSLSEVVVTGMLIARELHPGRGEILRSTPLDPENLRGTWPAGFHGSKSRSAVGVLWGPDILSKTCQKHRRLWIAIQTSSHPRNIATVTPEDLVLSLFTPGSIGAYA